MKTALDKAKADCAAGVDSATIRATLRTSIEAAKTKLRADMAAIEKAKADLKAAFPKEPKPPTNTNE